MLLSKSPGKAETKDVLVSLALECKGCTEAEASSFWPMTVVFLSRQDISSDKPMVRCFLCLFHTLPTCRRNAVTCYITICPSFRSASFPFRSSLKVTEQLFRVVVDTMLCH